MEGVEGIWCMIWKSRLAIAGGRIGQVDALIESCGRMTKSAVVKIAQVKAKAD